MGAVLRCGLGRVSNCFCNKSLKLLECFLGVGGAEVSVGPLCRGLQGQRVEAHLLRLSVCSLDSQAAEPEDAARTASSHQQLLDQRFVLLLQRQHDSSLQDGHNS